MNAPDRIDAVSLIEGEKKCYAVKEKKIPDSSKFYFIKEDHTLGNLLRHSLLEDRNVVFAGYRMPHPLENVLEIKVRTNGKLKPLDCMVRSLGNLQDEFQTFENRFDAELQARGLS